MFELKKMHLLHLTIFIYSILLANLSYPKNVSLNSKQQNSPGPRKTTNNEKIILILLGFDNYDKNDLRVSFDIFFVTTNKNININHLKFSATIEYSNSETGNYYQNKEVNCNFEKIIKNNKFNMSCSLELDNPELNYFKIIPNFNFDLDNIEVSPTPMANFFMSNSGSWDENDHFGFYDKKIYILENSYFTKNTNNIKNLNIYGVINGAKPNLVNKKLKIVTNGVEIGKIYQLLNCTLTNTYNNYYNLNCDMNNSLNIDLQSSMAYEDDIVDLLFVDEILIINLDNKCSGIKFFNDICTPIKINNNSMVSDFIYDILDDIENGKFNDIFKRAIEVNKTFTESEKNVTYHISTVSSQYSTNYSIFKLEDYESKLKEVYSLDKNEKLILLKVEYGIEKFKIPIIEYQLFIKNGTRLNPNYFDITIEIDIPVNIEKEEFIHNPNGNFYKDKCHTYTTEFGTDLSMYDRKNNYNKNYYALCEKNCEYKEYNKETKKVKCKCKTKTEFPLLPNKEVNLNELLHQFVDIIKHSNFFLFKCYKRVFSSEGQKNNSGSYINIIMTIGIIFCSIFFGIKGYFLYKMNIERMMSQNPEKMKQENRQNIIVPNNINIYSKDNNQKNEIISNNSNNNNTNSVKRINISNNSNNEDYSPHKSGLKVKSEKSYNDFELNNLEYINALEKDKRTFLQSYISLIKTKQLIYYTFFLGNDYNSKIIKISLFIFSLCLEYIVSSFFFHDGTMHQIYVDRGDYNFIYQLPNTIYSFLISYFITKLLSCFVLSEEKISKIIRNENPETDTKINNLFGTSLKIRFTIFFVLITLFHLLFWYFLSSFCAVYKNTQGTLIKNTILSILYSLIFYPFIICLILSIMRYCALRAKKKDKKCLYDASNVLGYIFL